MEHTLILIKPDGVLIGLAGQIIFKFEKKGFTLKGLKMITVDRLFAEKHYQDMFAKPLFRKYVNYICSGPVVAMIWEGEKVVSIGREIIENTIPTASDMDTDTGSNLIHGSDSLESAYKQISLWFPDGPVKVLSDDAATPNTGDIGRISVMGLDTMEQTLILILPDALKSRLVGQIIRLFDRKGFTLKGLKMITVDRSFAEKHYQHMSAKPFFSDCVNYMTSGPVVAMIWEGEKVVSTGREIIEMTIPCDEMDTDIGSNLFEGSDSVESANKEIALWFPDGPVELPCDAAQPTVRDIERISVTGFDPGYHHEDVERVLREHFASCGKITDVYIEKGRCVAYIYFVGEGAVAKALELGSEVGEWNLCAKAYPFMDDESTMLTVQGYNYKRHDDEIKKLLLHHFSSCGITVTEVVIFKRASVVTIEGSLAVDKALELSGSNFGRRKVVVKCLSKPPRYTVHKRRRPIHDPRTRFQK